MGWCRQATSHYLSQCWTRSMLPYGVTRPQCAKVTLIMSCHCHCSNVSNMIINRNHQQYSQSPVVKSGTINLSSRWDKNGFRQGAIKENHDIKGKLAQKLYDENIWLVNITKPFIFQFFLHLTSFVVVAILIKFYCLRSPFVPNLEAKSVFPKSTTRDSEHCWWSLLDWTTLKQYWQ